MDVTFWETIGAALGTWGFPIVICFAACYVLYKIVWRDKDEAKEREAKLQQSITENAVALSKVADTIDESNKVNRELSETNRHLVERMEDKLTDIDENVHKILDNLDKDIQV